MLGASAPHTPIYRSLRGREMRYKEKEEERQVLDAQLSECIVLNTFAAKDKGRAILASAFLDSVLDSYEFCFLMDALRW